MKASFAMAAIWSCTLGIAQAAGLSPVDISAEVNSDMTTFSGGSNYPQNGGPLTVAAIPFTLATIAPSSHTAVILTSGAVPQTFSIPVSRSGVTTAYTLINSGFGVCGTVIGEVDFVGVNSTFVYTLTEGTNVRDHFNDGFCNTVTAVAGTANFGPDRLDMQQINLPAGFATDTLLRIDLKGFGLGSSGEPFLAAVTMDGTVVAAAAATPVPTLDPRTLVVLCALLLILGVGLQRRAEKRHRE